MRAAENIMVGIEGCRAHQVRSEAAGEVQATINFKSVWIGTLGFGVIAAFSMRHVRVQGACEKQGV
jgi:hypothetical protein